MRKACGKVTHATHDNAVLAFKKLGEPANMNVYQCKRCKGWHLGKSSNPNRRVDRICQLLDKVLPVEKPRYTKYSKRLDPARRSQKSSDKVAKEQLLAT